MNTATSYSSSPKVSTTAFSIRRSRAARDGGQGLCLAVVEILAERRGAASRGAYTRTPKAFTTWAGWTPSGKSVSRVAKSVGPARATRSCW